MCIYSVGSVQCTVQACIALGWMRGNEPITLAVHSAECCVPTLSGHVFRAATEEHINSHKMAKCEKEDVQTRFCGRIAALEWLFFTCYCGLLSSDPWLDNDTVYWAPIGWWQLMTCWLQSINNVITCSTPLKPPDHANSQQQRATHGWITFQMLQDEDFKHCKPRKYSQNQDIFWKF